MARVESLGLTGPEFSVLFIKLSPGCPPNHPTCLSYSPIALFSKKKDNSPQHIAKLFKEFYYITLGRLKQEKKGLYPCAVIVANTFILPRTSRDTNSVAIVYVKALLTAS